MSKYGNQKPRGKVTRQYKRTVFLSCEGNNKTEKNYFKDYFKGNKEFNLKIINDTSTDPINMVHALIKDYEKNKAGVETSDMAFCLVDSDFKPEKNLQLKEADKIIESKNLSLKKTKNKGNIQLIVSCPCFEIWYICHFEYTTKQFNSNDEVIQYLRGKDKIPSYEKNMKNIYSCIKEKTNTAISNAKKLEIFALSSGKKLHTVDFAPSTEIYKIIGALIP